MKILVDIEERRSSVPAELAALDVELEDVVLPHGDYLVEGRLAVERKSVMDLHRSVTSGRLWAQLPGLAGLEQAYLLIEGRDLDAGPISRRGVRGAVLQVVDNGIAIIRSSDAADSALWLWLLAARVSRGTPLGRRGRRRRATSPMGVLTAIPGVSPSVAERLLERFGSVASVAQAQQSHLEEIVGIGPVRSEALRKALS